MLKLSKDFIGKKNYLKDLSTEDFEKHLPELAKILSYADYRYNYDDSELKADWRKLCDFSDSNLLLTSSSTRTGMKLCEHFFPNFFDIQNNKNQKFADFWNKDDLQKVLQWNRNSHSTPYLSELRRGIYFCFGLTKNTMFRPHLSKCVSLYYKQFESLNVVDPCCGWGGRLLGTVAAGNNYIGFEPNVETFGYLKQLVDFLGIHKYVTLYNDVAENVDKYDFPLADVVLTSPPYFDLEIYSNEDTQSHQSFTCYEEWVDGWLKVVILKFGERLHADGVSCWNVHNIGKMKMIEDVEKIHLDADYIHDVDFSLGSSARQSNKNTKKNQDLTRCFKKTS